MLGKGSPPDLLKSILFLTRARTGNNGPGCFSWLPPSERFAHRCHFLPGLLDHPSSLRTLLWLQFAVLHTPFRCRHRFGSSTQALLRFCPPPLPVLQGILLLLFSRGPPPLQIVAQGRLAFRRRDGFPRALMSPHRGLMMPVPEIPFDFPLAGPHDIDPTEVTRYPAGTDCGIPGCIDPRSEDVQPVLVQTMMLTVGEVVAAAPEVELAATSGPPRVPIDPGEVRTPAMHVVSTHRKARYVAGVDDDGDHRHPRHAVGLHRLVEVVHRDKVVVVGGHIVGQVDSRIVIVYLVVEGLGRQGCPSQIVVVLAP